MQLWNHFQINFPNEYGNGRNWNGVNGNKYTLPRYIKQQTEKKLNKIFTSHIFESDTIPDTHTCVKGWNWIDYFKII